MVVASGVLALKDLEDLLRLRSTIDRLIDSATASPKAGRNSEQARASLHDAATRARQFLRIRDLRAKYFDEALFADPAWDIMLDLFVSDFSQQRTPISAATTGARVPATTGLRWLNVLEKRGLVTRRNDPLDARRTHVSLSGEAFTRMRLLLEEPAATECQ